MARAIGKRKILWTLATATLWPLLATAATAGNERAEPQPLGLLRVLVAADELPELFSFSDGAARPGFERELVEGFARARKVKLQFLPVKSFDQIIPTLLRGEGDLVLGIVDTEARRLRVSFTSETYPCRHLAVTRKPDPPVTTTAALAARKVGVIPGTSWADAAALAGVPVARQVPCADLGDCLAALRARRISATVTALFEFALARVGDPELEAGAFLGPPCKAAWAVRKEDAALLQSLNVYLDGLRASPSRSALFVKYFNVETLDLVRRARTE